MDFLNFTDISFNPKESVGQLCEDLNNIIRKVIWYDTFHVQNTKCLQFVRDIIADMNNDKVMCGCFGLYPSYVAGILNTVKDIHFYILCEENKIMQNTLQNVWPKILHCQIVIKNPTFVCLGRTFSVNA